MAHLGAADLRALQRVQQLSKHGRRLQNKWRMNDGMLGQVTASSALRGHVAVKGSGRVLRPCIFLGDKVGLLNKCVCGCCLCSAWLFDLPLRVNPIPSFPHLYSFYFIHCATVYSGCTINTCTSLSRSDKVTVVDGAHRGVTGIVRRTSTANGLVWLDDGQSVCCESVFVCACEYLDDTLIDSLWM